MRDDCLFQSTMVALGLEPRTQQVKMTGFIDEAVENQGVKFIQAGTGTGKSFVVLTKALELARQTKMPSVVICPNNSLIDQYVNKDAPRIASAVGGKFVYIKGRSRYLCSQSRSMQELKGTSPEDHYQRLTAGGKLEWVDHGLDYTWGCPGAGDCSSSDAWEQDPNCPHHSMKHHPSCTEAFTAYITPASCACRQRKDGEPPRCSCRFYCGAFEAKRMAESADVVITNAHLLVWDYLVRAFTVNQVQLLPDRGALFVDECHELESVGRNCQSDEIKPGSKVYDVVPDLQPWVDRVALEMINAAQTEALLGRDDKIKAMAEWAKVEINNVLDRAEIAGTDPDLAKEYRKEAATLQRFVDFVAESDQHISIIELQPTQPWEEPKVHLRRVCIDTSYAFSEILQAQPSILVSGTIPDSDPRRLGVGRQATIDDVGHPFDYSKSRFVISQHRGNDRLQTYQRASQVAKAINSKGGGGLILFTSWKDLEEAMPMIVSQLDAKIASEVYVQSREDPTTLRQDIEDFRQHGSAVLAGVASLWTGLDIPGDALRTVCIWKLPYGVPTLEAKAIERVYGKQVYWDAMLMRLVQGVGRLIRTTEDTGLVFIADSRAKQQKWGMNRMTRHIKEFS